MGNAALGPPAHDYHTNGAEIIWVDVHHLLAPTAKALRELSIRIHKAY
jgi:hypothetical protein